MHGKKRVQLIHVTPLSQLLGVKIWNEMEFVMNDNGSYRGLFQGPFPC